MKYLNNVSSNEFQNILSHLADDTVKNFKMMILIVNVPKTYGTSGIFRKCLKMYFPTKLDYLTFLLNSNLGKDPNILT
jgi:hypothetical protein